MSELEKKLEKFAEKNSMKGKGALAVALVVTRHAKDRGLPLKPADLLTDGRGQVLGLGKGAVQTILAEHGINKVLAEEGGRTSRGSVGNMEAYVAFLNDLKKAGKVDLVAIEKWWIEKVKGFFIAKPFVLALDPAKSLRAVVQAVIDQAQKRQKDSAGATFVGTMLQHLVGAKLDVLLDNQINHYGASVADGVSGRDADFTLNDVAIHVTSAPSEAVIRKCKANLNLGLRPVLITLPKGVHVADGLAEVEGIADRIDIFDAVQFLAGNLYEIGRFETAGRRATAERIIERYNQIIDICETDPSLKIVIGKEPGKMSNSSHSGPAVIRIE